ncbi:MAG: lysylphosphatidylglycerol synthase transmembrane domain-containing protein [Xanthobacteraceae bacterium]
MSTSKSVPAARPAGEQPLSHAATPMRARGGRHWLTFGLSLALSAIILYYVFQRVDGRLLQQLVKTQSRSLLTAAAFFIFLQIILGGERWRAILSALTRERQLPALRIQAVYYASIFFNCLPFGTLGGDVARVLLARRFTVSVKQLVLSVLIDRIVMVVALILLCVVTLPAIAHPLARDAWFGCIAALIVGMTGFVLLEPIERILGRWRRWNLVQMVLHAAAELRYLGRGRGLLGLLYGMLSGASAALAGYCIALSLNIDIGPVAIIAVMSLMSFAVALPISAAGWGVREASLVTLLGLIGVDRSASLLLSVELGLLTTLLSLPGGVVWLMLRDRSPTARRTRT